MIDALLDRLARERGISDTYQNYRGEPRSISRATKAGILEVMGCAVGDVVALERDLAQLEAERWSALLPPVAVLGLGRTGVLVTVPIDSMQDSLQWRVALADGDTTTASVCGVELEEFERREIRGRWYTRRLLVLPDNLPQGYHSLDVHLAGVGLFQAGDDAQRGRLARAAGAEQHEELAFGDVQADVGQRAHRADGFVDAVQGNASHGACSRCGCA